MPYKDKADKAANAKRYYDTHRNDYHYWARKHGDYIKEYVRALKEASPCVDCGQSYRYWVMHFDHIGTDKVFGISNGRSFSRERVQSEIAKCELVCSNCHATRTFKRMEDKGLIRESHTPEDWASLIRSPIPVTHCPRGHEYTPENTYDHGRSGRCCRICERARHAAYRERKRNGS